MADEFMSLREFLLLEEDDGRPAHRDCKRAGAFVALYDIAKESWLKYGSEGPPVGSGVLTLQAGHGGMAGVKRTFEGKHEEDNSYFSLSYIADEGNPWARKQLSLVKARIWFVSFMVVDGKDKDAWKFTRELMRQEVI